MEAGKYIISASPHARTGESIPKIMYSVIVALIPAAAVSVYVFGPDALALMLVCVAVCLLTEYVFQKVRCQDVSICDGSAAVAGLILAMTLPPGFPLWAAAIGSIVTMALGKHLFGGLGFNIFNPALVGRAFLQAAFPAMITKWVAPFSWMAKGGIDAVSTATPLALMKFDAKFVGIKSLAFGGVGGSLGETCGIALIIGALFLLSRGYIQWRIPAAIFLTVLVFGGTFYFIDSAKYPNPGFHIFAGGMCLGALFMATDMVSSPMTNKGFWIYGIGIGVLTIIIRLFGGLPEGVMYSILFMNAFTPLINKFTVPKTFGK